MEMKKLQKKLQILENNYFKSVNNHAIQYYITSLERIIFNR